MQKLDKFLRNFDRLLQKQIDNFLHKFEFRAVQKCANLVDLAKCCKIIILVVKIDVDPAENELGGAGGTGGGRGGAAADCEGVVPVPGDTVWSSGPSSVRPVLARARLTFIS